MTTISSPTLAPARGLRTLYLVRVVFSAVWVVLVLLLASAVTTATSPTPAAVVLLAIYPLWDAVATVIDLRVAPAGPRWPRLLNIGADVVATVLLAVLLPLAGVTAGLIVFGVWAFLTGGVQLLLAIRRRRAIGGQWPMMISGGLSVIAGIAFAAMASTPSSGLATLAGYSGFGAFWYLVEVILLTVRTSQRATTANGGDGGN